MVLLCAYIRTDEIQGAVHEYRVSGEEEHDLANVPFRWPHKPDLEITDLWCQRVQQKAVKFTRLIAKRDDKIVCLGCTVSEVRAWMKRKLPYDKCRARDYGCCVSSVASHIYATSVRPQGQSASKLLTADILPPGAGVSFVNTVFEKSLARGNVDVHLHSLRVPKTRWLRPTRP